MCLRTHIKLLLGLRRYMLMGVSVTCSGSAYGGLNTMGMCFLEITLWLCVPGGMIRRLRGRKYTDISRKEDFTPLLGVSWKWPCALCTFRVPISLRFSLGLRVSLSLRGSHNLKQRPPRTPPKPSPQPRKSTPGLRTAADLSVNAGNSQFNLFLAAPVRHDGPLLEFLS